MLKKKGVKRGKHIHFLVIKEICKSLKVSLFLLMSLSQGVPEDLLFFYESLRHGGGVVRVDECLLVYRYHEQAATHSVLE